MSEMTKPPGCGRPRAPARSRGRRSRSPICCRTGGARRRCGSPSASSAAWSSAARPASRSRSSSASTALARHRRDDADGIGCGEPLRLVGAGRADQGAQAEVAAATTVQVWAGQRAPSVLPDISPTRGEIGHAPQVGALQKQGNRMIWRTKIRRAGARRGRAGRRVLGLCEPVRRASTSARTWSRRAPSRHR